MRRRWRARCAWMKTSLKLSLSFVDFGHTPFGHTGEDALNERMKKFGGFDHNADRSGSSRSLSIATLISMASTFRGKRWKVW